MRRLSAIGLGLVLSVLAGAPVGAPALGQDDADNVEDATYFSDYERPGLGALTGFTREDGVIVLSDRGFCAYLLGAVWGKNEVQGARAWEDASRKRTQNRRSVPGWDPDVLDACATALAWFSYPLTQSYLELPEWANRAPVVPQAFLGLLREPVLDPPTPTTIVSDECDTAFAKLGPEASPDDIGAVVRDCTSLEELEAVAAAHPYALEAQPEYWLRLTCVLYSDVRPSELCRSVRID